MSRTGDEGLRWSAPAACRIALLLCLLFAPGAFAQKLRSPRLVVRQTTTESLTLIRPCDPVFEGILDTYFPGLSDAPAYKTSLRPFLVILRNDTAQTAVAYSVVWTRHYTDGQPTQLSAMIVNRPLTLRSELAFLRPGQMRLISPMFDLTPKQFAQQRNSMAKYPVKGFPWDKFITSVSVDLDGVVFGDGTFIGPDKTRVLQRYVMARFATRDEVLAALNLINSSTASPYTAAKRLNKMFLDEFHWEEKANQRTLLALYVRARGSSALDLDAILRRHGLGRLEKVLQTFANHHSGSAAESGGKDSPSMFGRMYQKLSPNDPRVFGTSPGAPNGCLSRAAAAALAANLPEQGQAVTVVLATPQQPVEAGKPLILCVTVNNNSDNEVSLPQTPWTFLGDNVQVHIFDAAGRPVLRPPRPKNAIWAGSMSSLIVEPGKSRWDKLDITRLYKLPPGKYTIWVGGPFYSGSNSPSGTAKSNVISVKVVKHVPAGAMGCPVSPGN